MVSFSTKKIVSQQTVPETLRQVREERGEDITKIAKALNIQSRHLLALEEGAYEKIPGEIYARQWLRAYGRYLDIDVRWLLKEYERERGVQMQFSGFNLPEVKTSRLVWLTPQALKFCGLAIVILGLSAYLGLSVKNILQPPTLVIYEPSNNLITEQGIINITGQTEPETELTINSEIVLADEQGNFNKQINLSSGLNILEVIATKKHGAQNKTVISIFRQTEESGKPTTSISLQTTGL
jgi:transcriptional regulator with XRE-family HTH domain